MNTARHWLRRGALTLVVGLAWGAAAWAQNAAEQNAGSRPTIAWQRGKCVGQLGKVAQVDVPEEFQFTGAEGTAIWLQENGQRASERNIGVLAPSSLSERWFLVFSYDPCGYVRDTDRANLQPDAMLKTLQALTEANNALRAANKLPPVQLVGWASPPHYNEKNQHLSWITQVVTGDQPSLNVGVRILGRRGVLVATLLAMPAEIPALLPTLKKLLAEVRFLPGEAYSDWRQGDPVSTRTLQTLIIGEPRPAAAPGAAQGSAAPGASATADSDRMANQVIMVLLAIGAVVLLILIYRLMTRVRGR